MESAWASGSTARCNRDMIRHKGKSNGKYIYNIEGKISYNIDGIIYEADLIAENDVIKSNFIETLLQILLAIIVLILIAEFFSHKRKKQKNNKKNLRKNSSVYKFNLE